jgi:hypothetical protein
MKSFLRRSKCDKSTLRKIEIIMRRGYFRKRARQNARRGCEC